MSDISVSKSLLQLGISPNAKGFHYLRLAVPLYIKNRELPVSMSNIYSEIAAKFTTTPSSVEKAIRNSIQSGWHKRDLNFSKLVFFHLLQSEIDIPSNALFVSALGEWLLIQEEDNEP